MPFLQPMPVWFEPLTPRCPACGVCVGRPAITYGPWSHPDVRGCDFGSINRVFYGPWLLWIAWRRLTKEGRTWNE